MQSFTIIRMLLSASACSDSFLQTDSPNQPSQTTYWQTESDALMALTACYDAMQSQNLYDDNIDGWKFDFWDAKPAQTMVTTHGVTGC